MTKEAADLRRFLDKVDTSDTDPASCWPWTAYKNHPQPYGRFRYHGKLWNAHRWAYERFVGPVPEGLTLDHLCKRKDCVNPFHLEPVTNAENIRRGTQGWQQRAKTHCPRGHPYDEKNTYINRRGQRICRTCTNDRTRESRRRAKCQSSQ